VIALTLLPAVLYPRTWVVPRFIAIVGFVFFICINCNVMLFKQPLDFTYLIFQLLILVETVLFIVDDIIDS